MTIKVTQQHRKFILEQTAITKKPIVELIARGIELLKLETRRTEAVNKEAAKQQVPPGHIVADAIDEWLKNKDKPK